MNNNLTLSVTLTGDGRQLSGTLKDAQGDVREFTVTTERESRKASDALTAPGRSAETVSEHLRETQREARAFGTEATRGGREANQALAQTSTQAQTTTSHFNSLRRMAGLALGAFSVRQVAGMVDGWSDMQSVVGAAIGDMSEAGDMMRRITDIANASYAPLELTARTYASNVSSLRDLGRTANEAADFTESLNHMLVLTATRGQQAESVQNALSRAMAVGRLQADGLETVLANGGEVAQALANQLGVTVSQLRGLATEGRITGDVIASALIGSLDDVRERAGEMPATIEDGFVRIGTSATRLVGELDQAMGASEGVAGILIGAADMMTAAIDPLVDNIDDIQFAATAVAVVLAGRYVGAIATSQAALAAKTAVVATTTGAINLLTGATTRQAAAATAMAGATRVATGALALVGGPAGAAVIAAGAIYYFREELGLVPTPAITAAGAVDELALRVDGAADSMLKFEVAAFTAELVSLQTAAQQASENLERLERTASQPYSYGQGQQGDLTAGVNRQRGQLESINNQISAREDAIAKLNQRIEQMNAADEESEDIKRSLQITIDGLNDTTQKAAAAANELTKATEAQATALEALRNRLIPGRREVVQLAQDMQTLTLAIAMGTGNVAQNIQMMGLLQQQYIEAQKDTDDLAAKSEDAGSRIANSFDTWGTVADNTLRRVDDSGKDTWLGLVDGSTSALDTVKRGFQQTLAEIAHMLTTQRLTFHVAGMMGLDTTGMAGGQRGGLNVGSLKSGWDTVSGLWGGGSAASTAAAGYGAAGWAGSATGAYTGWAGSAAAGAAQAGGGFMSAASAAMPWVAGGLLVDNVLGLGITEGIVKGISSIFGGGKSDPRLNISTRGDAGQFSHDSVRSGAFGAVGFSEGTKRSNDLFGSVEAEREWLASVAALDNMTAAAARTPEQLNAMTAAVHSMVITSGDAQGAIDQLAGRTAAATSVIDSELTQSLINAGATAEQIAQRFASATSAMDTLANASDRLNLQFDASAAGAYRAADSLSQRVGGPEALSQLLSGYYDAFYTEEQKFNDLAAGLSSTFAEMGHELPTTREGVRDLVEGLQLMGDAGQQQLATILQLNQPLAQYIAALDQQRAALDSGAASMRSLADIANEKWRLENELLTLEGNARAVIDRQRAREWEATDESNRLLQERVWLLEDEQTASRAAAQAQQALNDTYRQHLIDNGNVSSIEASYRTYQLTVDAINQSARLRAEQFQNEMRALTSLRDLSNSLLLSSQSILDPAERLQEAQEQFARLSVRAENGDTEAVGMLQSASLAYLDEAASYYGQSSSQYAAIFSDVTGGIDDLERQFGASVRSLGSLESIQERALQEQRRASDLLNSQLLQQVNAYGELETIADLLALLPAELARGISGVIGQQTGGSAGGGSSLGSVIAGARGSKGYLDNDGARAVYDYLRNTGGTLSDAKQYLVDGANDPAEWARKQGLPMFDTGAWSLSKDQLAFVHAREMVVPSRGGIADEFRAYASGDYQAELMAGISDIKRTLPMSMPNIPPIVNTPAPINLEPLTRELAALRLEVAQLRSERRNDAVKAAGQRALQVSEQRKGNRNSKLKGKTV